MRTWSSSSTARTCMPTRPSRRPTRKASPRSSSPNSATARPASSASPSSGSSPDSRTSRSATHSRQDCTMIRPTVARVDLRALQSNYRALAEYLESEPRGTDRLEPPRIIAVVKANAYGHGAGQVARALETAGADLVACADLEEGAALRAAGVGAEILVFGALSVSDLEGLFDCRLTPTISTPSAARAVQAAAAKHKERLRYHLKIDTGMNRLGFRFDNLRRTLPELLASPNLELDAIYSHFATADDLESGLFNEQRLRFARALRDIESLRPAVNRRPYLHLANSAA